MNGAEVAREEIYRLTHGQKGGKGKGGGGMEYFPDLDERQFRRGDKLKGESSRDGSTRS